MPRTTSRTYFAAVVDGFHSRTIVVRETVEEILAVHIAGKNPRIFRVPVKVIHDNWKSGVSPLCRYIQVEDGKGHGIPVGGPS